MDIFFFAAFVAPVVALVERNHRRNAGFPTTALGATGDRDLDRVRHDLATTDSTPARRPRLRRMPSQSAHASSSTATC